MAKLILKSLKDGIVQSRFVQVDDPKGAQFGKWERDALAGEPKGVCAECGKRGLEQTFVCADGGEEYCFGCVVVIEGHEMLEVLLGLGAKKVGYRRATNRNEFSPYCGQVRRIWKLEYTPKVGHKKHIDVFFEADGTLENNPGDPWVSGIELCIGQGDPLHPKSTSEDDLLAWLEGESK